MSASSTAEVEPAKQQASDAGSRRQVGVALAAATIWVGCALFLTVTPSPPGVPGVSLQAIVGHVLLGILVGGSFLCVARAIWVGSNKLRPLLVASAGVCALFLVGTEFLQVLTPSRTPELSDGVANVLGVALITAVLVTAFSMGPLWAGRAANWFTWFAIVAAAIMVISTIAAPPVELPSLN